MLTSRSTTECRSLSQLGARSPKLFNVNRSWIKQRDLELPSFGGVHSRALRVCVCVGNTFGTTFTTMHRVREGEDGHATAFLGLPCAAGGGGGSRVKWQLQAKKVLKGKQLLSRCCGTDYNARFAPILDVTRFYVSCTQSTVSIRKPRHPDRRLRAFNVKIVFWRRMIAIQP